MLYALMGLGLSLITGILNIPNFAHGALFAIGDEELLEYFNVTRRFHPFRIPDSLPTHLAPISEALTVLASLHRQRNRRPVADTISALLAARLGAVAGPKANVAAAAHSRQNSVERSMCVSVSTGEFRFRQALDAGTNGEQATAQGLLVEFLFLHAARAGGDVKHVEIGAAETHAGGPA